MNENKTQNQESVDGMLELTLAEFLESIPPNQEVQITDLAAVEHHPGGEYRPKVDLYYVHTPEIQLHCPDDPCNGTRFYRYAAGGQIPQELHYPERKYIYLTYRCSNCQKKWKIFSLSVQRRKDGKSGVAYKFGE